MEVACAVRLQGGNIWRRLVREGLEVTVAGKVER